MKANTFPVVALLCLLSAVNHQISIARAQGTAFTYQGRLVLNGNPVPNGDYVFAFNLYDAPSNGLFLAQKFATNGVTNGLFTSTVDYGEPSLTFPGAARWLEIQVATNENGPFATMLPRQ